MLHASNKTNNTIMTFFYFKICYVKKFRSISKEDIDQFFGFKSTSNKDTNQFFIEKNSDLHLMKMQINF